MTKDKKPKQSRAAVIKAENVKSDPKQIIKAEGYTAIEDDPFINSYSGGDVLEPPYPIAELDRMVEYSTILQQCIDAYKRNITGFGTLFQYHEDLQQVDETPEMKAEYERYKELVQYFNFDKSFEDVWGQAIEHREKTGNGYIEILRDGTGLPVGGENVDPLYMRTTKMTKTEVDYLINGKSFKRQRGFRKYVQQWGTQYIWFKEFGDPRFMDLRTGTYTATHNGDNEANEILHLRIGDKPYGVPRWIGQLIHMYGARKAEELNYNYFENGRHTPAAIVVSNGMLTEDSIEKLQDYANGVKGVENAHKFLLLEAEGLDDGVLPGEDRQGVRVELKSLADILQSDALFLDYDEKSREKVQSAFRLPDLYVGRSKDFNRATADTAKQVTEEQVFEPERTSIEFLINKVLFAPHQFQSVEVKFQPVVISDIADKVAMLGILNTIGSVTPNDTRDEVGKILGKDLEPFDMPEADLSAPLRGVVATQQAQEFAATQAKENAKNQPNNNNNFKKSEEQFVSILKDVRDALEEMNDGQNKSDN